MEKILQQMSETLHQQNQLIGKIIELGKEKRELIVLGKVDELDKRLQRENFLVASLEKMEKERYKLQKNIASMWEMDIKDLSAAFLMKKTIDYSQEIRESLKKELDELEFQMDNLRIINNENNELIQQSLDYVYTMQSSVEGDDGAGTYSGKGIQNEGNIPHSRLKIFDKKV